MGATDFFVKSQGENIREAYTNAVQDAIDEYGNDIYNGTISTTHDFRDVTNLFEKSGKSVVFFIEEQQEKMQKRDCFAICTKKPVSNENKIKTQVQHVVEKGTKKWLTKYVVYEFSVPLGYYNLKADAVNAARKHTEKTKNRTIVRLQKHLEKGSNEVAIVKYKESSKESLGTWIFFGFAAC
jgi:hypothetical protein